MDLLRKILHKEVSFLTSTALLLALFVVFFIVRGGVFYVLLAMLSILIAVLILAVYWFIKRRFLSAADKWSYLLSIIVWLSLFYSMFIGLSGG